jgi:hypothetical protein
MKKKAEDLRAGDVLSMVWAGHHSTVKCFHEYTGTLDFILKVAEFYDGSRMSLEKGHYYECIE